MNVKEAVEFASMIFDYDKDMSETPEKYEEALNLIKRMIYKGELYDKKEEGMIPFPDYNFYRCPKCGSVVVLLKNYCRDCGQAIDWSEK